MSSSPPPPVTYVAHEDVDAATIADPALEQAQANTRRNTGSAAPPPPTRFGILSGNRTGGSGGAPVNPFARTLETQEAEYGLRKESAAQNREAADEAGQQPRPGAGRPALDVDAFKNILMTGSATPSQPEQNQPQKAQDSSSSTDASSVSRQPMWDSAHEAHPESPRTPWDEHEHEHYSPPSDNDDSENEQSSLMGPVASRPVEEGPPRPPKPGQSRPYPQTVSFAEFDEAVPSASPISAPRTPPVDTQRLSGYFKPSLPRSPSDLNKPLPPPPAETERRASPMQQPTIAIPTTGDQPQAKKAPPPPPVSRRQAQPSSSEARGRSASNLSSASSQQPSEADVTSRPSDQNLKPAPPPPPSRRAQTHSNVPSPAIETPSSVPSPNKTPAAEAKSGMPPPPPRRHASKNGSSGVNRTPSTSSRTSLPRSDSFTGSATSGGHAPPAPPPRRGAGASKRSSIDGPPSSLSGRRTSEQSFHSEREGLTQVDEPQDEGVDGGSESVQAAPPQSDILADMTAFQAEIDALRAQQTGRN